VVQLTRTGVRSGDGDELDRARHHFQAQHHLLLPRFLDSELLGVVQCRVARSRFALRVAHKVSPPAVDLKLDNQALQAGLRFMLSDPVLLRNIERITGYDSLTAFAGAVYRLEPGRGHRDSWHNDVDGSRTVGITINLSERAFLGGELQMRRANTQRRLWSVANIGFGDAVLFAIDVTLQHRIAPMKGSTPKTALAGWFCHLTPQFT